MRSRPRSKQGLPQRYYKDHSPTLTTSNKYLMVISVDVHRPDSEREFLRWVHPAERLTFQGFNKHTHLELRAAPLTIKAAGNAYPVPLMMANWHPILERIAKSGIDLMTPPMATLERPDHSEAVDRVVDALTKPARRVPKPARRP